MKRKTNLAADPDSKRRVRFSEEGDRKNISRESRKNRELDWRNRREEFSNTGEYEDDDGDDEDVAVDRMTNNVDGEEDWDEKVNDEGVTLEPFNLRNEREEGYFDVNGNFVWRVQDLEPDAWLAGLDDVTMEEAAGEAMQAQKKKKKNIELQDSIAEKNPRLKLSQSDLIEQAVLLLNESETVLGALKRYGKYLSNRNAKDTLNEDANVNRDIMKKNFEILTDIADILLEKGLADIYYSTRKDLIAMQSDSMTTEFSKSSVTSSERIIDIESIVQPEQKTNVFFEYRGKDGNIYGPFNLQQIRVWMEAGYFSGENSVMMRQITSEDKSSTAAEVEISSELIADLEEDAEDSSKMKEESVKEIAEVWIPSDKINLLKFLV